MLGRKKQKSENRVRQPLNRPLRGANYTYFSPSKDSLDQLAKTKSPEKKKGRRAHLNTLLIAIIVLGFVYETFLIDTPKVVVQNPSNALVSSQNEAAYGQYAKSEIDKNFSNRNKITINTSAIAAGLQKKFPEIGNVSVIVPIFGQQPVVNIEMSSIVLILQEKGGKQYLINTSGVAVGNGGLNNKNLPVVADESGLAVSIGKQVLPASYVSFIEFLSSQFSAKQIKVKSLELSADGEMDVYVSGESYFVKFNLNDVADDGQQIGDYFAVDNYLGQQGIKPSQYIDARVPGRAYYR